MIPDEPIRGRYAYLDQPGLFGLSGLQQFRPFLKRQVPFAPLYHLSGLVVAEVGPGGATFTMPASPWWRSGAGVFLTGTFAFVADAALGSAIYTTLPPGMGLATSELSMSFLRPATPGSGTLIARAKLIQAGKAIALSEATVEDARGMLLAHATSRCVLAPLPFEPPPPPDGFPSFDPPPEEPPDPHARPPEGRVVAAEVLEQRSWLEVDQLWIKGELPLPPACHLTGMRPVEAEEGRAVWEMPASEWFATALRTFYGGAVAYLADAVMANAVSTTLPPRVTCGTLDLKVNFLRPVQPDGRELRAAATVVHRGRTIAVASADIEDADGRRVAIATASSMVIPGRRWDEAGTLAVIDEPTSTEEEPDG